MIIEKLKQIESELEAEIEKLGNDTIAVTALTHKLEGFRLAMQVVEKMAERMVELDIKEFGD